MRKRISILIFLICLIFPFIVHGETKNEYGVKTVTPHEIKMIAQTLYGEARGESTQEQAAVVWCILNRVDDERFPGTVKDVITQKYQFSGYSPNNPVWENLKDLAHDVVLRWQKEQLGFEDVGRVLPKEYLFFTGVDGENRFRKEFKSDGYWCWSDENPYGE